MRSRGEPVVLPPTNGLLPDGSISTITTHQALVARTVASATPRPATRRRSVVLAEKPKTRAKAGRTRYAWRYLVRNAKPTHVAARATHRKLPWSSERSSAQAAVTSSRVRSASGLLKRNIRTAAGVRAMTTAAISAAAGPNDRFTARKRTPTVATPAAASGA